MSHDPIDSWGQFERLLDDLGWPRLPSGDRVIEGRADWVAALEWARPSQRRAWLVALGPHLVTATDTGRARLAAWRKDRDPLPPTVSAADLRSYVADQVQFHGGGADAEAVVVDALCAIPEPVRDDALRRAVFVNVTPGCGWTTSARFCDDQGAPIERIIVLGWPVSRELVAHEISHVWHDAPLDGSLSRAVPAAAERGFEAYAEAVGFPINTYRDRQERLAEACALAWTEGPPWQP